MNLRLLLTVCIFYVHTASAQQEKSYPVKAGEIPGEVLPKEAIYVLPAFTTGTAFLKDGTSSTLRFNYNLLLDEMHFINEKGDTLAIADPLLINSVVIDSVVFYYDKNYLREILRQGDYKLAIRQQMVQLKDKTRGGYDTPSELGSIKTYESVSNNSQLYHLQVQRDVLFREITSFYIANASNHFLKANKKNFYSLFARNNIEEYLKEHNINFNNEADLEALLRFCTK